MFSPDPSTAVDSWPAEQGGLSGNLLANNLLASYLEKARQFNGLDIASGGQGRVRSRKIGSIPTTDPAGSKFGYDYAEGILFKDPGVVLGGGRTPRIPLTSEDRQAWVEERDQYLRGERYGPKGLIQHGQGAVRDATFGLQKLLRGY